MGRSLPSLLRGGPGRVQRDRDGLLLRTAGPHLRADVFRDGLAGIAFFQRHTSSCSQGTLAMV